ncbi:3TM-type holin [Zavarzinia aquatilis]|uniref:Holin n=1 Tax=Zavarzinia aquatilis TaxID=2211142 RepID=A0A317EFC2_9PROT|nr:3TM-type holin [Zavarzinia aquatilis]PWR24994.1 hypothetical protein DKG74_04285 [Zavarzinia aquatilis]
MPVLAALLPVLGPILGDVLKSLFPDPAQAAQAQLQIQMKLMEQSASIEAAAADIIKTEAASEHWLTATWRPIVMLLFAGLITARWFGWAAPDLSEAEYTHLWDIVEWGIGGYVIGRSAEKTLPATAGAVAASLKR